MYQVIEDHYKHYRKAALKRVMPRVGRCPHAADDIVQEAYTRAMEYFSAFNPEKASFDTWFRTILNRTVKNWKADDRLSGMTKDVESLEEYHVLTCEEVHETGRTSDEILKEIESLEGLRKDVCYLYFIKGYKPQDIGKVLDCNSHSARTYIHTFKTKMKEKYEEGLRL